MHASRQISRGRLLRTKAAPLQSRASPMGFALGYNDSQLRC